MEKWKRQLIRRQFHYAAHRMDIEAGHRAKDPHVPSAVYKYRSFSPNHKAALLEGVLWRSSPENFNDPYDSFVTFNQDHFYIENESVEEAKASVEELERSLGAGEAWTPKPLNNPIRQDEWTSKISNDLLQNERAEVRDAMLRAIKSLRAETNEQMVRAMSESSRAGLSVISLSENSTSVLMWSHYSDNHKGFCIEYDLAVLPESDLRRRLCYPVFYRTKLVDITRYIARRDPRSVNILFGKYVSLLKSDEWAYEREWRIVFNFGPSDANSPMAMPKPKAIILGALADPCDRAWMRSFCHDRGIPLKQVTQRHNEFRLEVADAPSA